MNSVVSLSDVDTAANLKLIQSVTGHSPFVTPEAAAVVLTSLMRGMRTLHQAIEGAPSIKQEWGTCSDIAKIYGKNRSTITRLIGPMAAEGKIRTCTTKDGATGAYGASMYNLADVQRCFMENAREAARQAG